MGEAYRKLSEDFIVPPYSILDTRTESWQSRKRALRAIIGGSFETREGTLYNQMEMRMPDIYAKYMSGREDSHMNFKEFVDALPEENIEKHKSKDVYNGVSTFDPVLAEILIRWFTPHKGSRVFDCFAGGITKGAVACMCGHRFVGLEIRKDQVEINNEKVKRLNIDAEYYIADGRQVTQKLGIATQDLLITCPPYYNLEVYSNLPEDASNQSSYDDYLRIVWEAFKGAVKALKKNRFCIVVISDVRDERGAYRNLPGDIVDIFRGEGCFLWNEFILLNNDATAKLRARKYMNTRKVVRMHQKVLVFFNGNPLSIPKLFPKIARQCSEK